jgi:hypothetical protein
MKRESQNIGGNDVKSLNFSVMATLALTLALPAFGDSPSTQQWVLATAKATGVGGANFVSSLRIVNPGTTLANVTLTYLPQSPIDSTYSASGDNTSALSVGVQVPAGQMLPIEDVIGSLFNGSGPFGIVAGGIKVVSDQPVSVLSRTYVSNAVSVTGVPGTYGFSIPAQVANQAISVGDTGYVPYIAASPSTNSGFRCNFIMLNTIGTTSVVNVALKKQDGTVIGQRSYTLGNFSAAQQGDIAASFGYPGPDQDLFVVVTVTSGGPVVVGTSIVDNAISSLNYAPPTKTVSTASDGVYGIVFQSAEDPYGLISRVDISGGDVQYLTFSVGPTGCAYVFSYQAGPPTSSLANTTFTKNSDGSISFSGGDISQYAGDPSNWTGTIQFTATGIAGYLNFSFTSQSADCPGTSIHYEFVGERVAPLTY